MQTAPTLAARGIVFDYPGPLRALDGVDVGVHGGDLTVVIGPNGAGKSTLLKVLAGFLRPARGTVELAGRALSSFPRKERARSIAVVPQFLPVLPEVRVADFVLSGRYARLERWNTVRAHDRDAVTRALQQCDALDLAGRGMAELSGGQRQRVLVARALAQEAQVLLVDEPTHSLDPAHQIQVFDLIAGLRDEGRAAFVVTHELNLASQFATRLVLMQSGRVVATGASHEVLVRSVLEPVYGRHLYYGEWPASGRGARSTSAGDARARPFVLPWHAE